MPSTRLLLVAYLLAAPLVFCQTAMAQDFYKGVRAVERGDYAEALQEWRPLAERGVAEAQYNLGIMYGLGRGVPQNYVEAARWYRMAADQGDAEAQYSLGLMYLNGWGVDQDDAEASRWWHRAAEQGSADAQLSIGYLYQFGRGVRQSHFEAVYWFRKAAEQGVSKAQFELGSIYAEGLGVPKNQPEAIRWFRQAAEQGQSGAQLQLGFIYRLGQGVRQDSAEAARWWRKSAEQGDSIAQYMLGLSYAFGQGVPKNHVFAYKWASLSAAQGDEDALALLGELESEMAREQVAEAQRLAADFPGHVGPGSVEQATVGSTPQSLPRSERPSPVISATVRQIQAHLIALGYEPGPVDGIMGQLTTSAIRSFQQDFGIQPDGLASTTLEALLAVVVEERKGGTLGDTGSGDLELTSTGTGFFVSEEGHVLTNHHVVEGCQLVRVVLPSGSVEGETHASNAADDLAVIRVAAARPTAIAAFRDTSPVLGEDVIVIGYPLQSVLGSAVNVTFGSVSSTSGPGGDRRFFQITAPVQQGNSGGPLLDESGAVLGVVVAKLDALSVAISTGDIPQNINFAIKGAVARSFLSINDVGYQVVPAQPSSPGRPAVVGLAQDFTVPVECWQ